MLVSNRGVPTVDEIITPIPNANNKTLLEPVFTSAQSSICSPTCRTLKIIVGVAMGSVILLAVFCYWISHIRKRRKIQATQERDQISDAMWSASPSIWIAILRHFVWGRRLVGKAIMLKPWAIWGLLLLNKWYKTWIETAWNARTCIQSMTSLTFHIERQNLLCLFSLCETSL